MGYQDEASLVLEEPPLEPLYGLDIEVVGRLVEEEELRPRRQGAGKGGFLHHAARHPGHEGSWIAEAELGAEGGVGPLQVMAAGGRYQGLEFFKGMALRPPRRLEAAPLP